MQLATLLRDITATYQHDPAYIWQDDAACAFQPHTLFEIAREGDPIAEGLDAKELHDLNLTNLKAGQKICGTCPVFDQCYLSANLMDFRETMRAGVMPSRFGPGAKAPLEGEPPCKRGHDNWTTNKRGHRECLDCQKQLADERNAQLKAEREAAGRTKRTRQGVSRGKLCQAGWHDEWIESSGDSKNVRYTCLPCKRAKDADDKRKKREAAKVGG